MGKENKIEIKQQVKNRSKKINFKKCILVIGIIVLIIVILVAIFGGGPKKVIKQYVSGMNKQDTSKIIESMDFTGESAWEFYDKDNFSEDNYNTFINDYGNVDENEIKDEKDYWEEIMNSSFDNIKDEYESYKLKIEKFKAVDKLGKNLYAVDVEISIIAKPKDNDDNEIDETETVTFIVYKNKIISAIFIGL